MPILLGGGLGTSDWWQELKREAEALLEEHVLGKYVVELRPATLEELKAFTEMGVPDGGMRLMEHNPDVPSACFAIVLTGVVAPEALSFEEMHAMNDRLGVDLSPEQVVQMWAQQGTGDAHAFAMANIVDVLLEATGLYEDVDDDVEEEVENDRERRIGNGASRTRPPPEQ